uniref:BHLH domain-containing protein n=1 Tax=Opuntia streptacantha TaxID=393608 RepID=A0A7C8ZMP5_OPUST
MQYISFWGAQEMSTKFNSSKSSSSNADRKTIEKNRRNDLKQLYSQLYSLVHNRASSSGETKRLPDQIEEATNYIKNLQEEVGKLKEKKDKLLGTDRSNTSEANCRKRLLLNSPVQIEGPAFHTIHAQFGEAAANNAVERIAKRLKKFTL